MTFATIARYLSKNVYGLAPPLSLPYAPILLTDEEFASRVKARKEGKLNEWKVDEIKNIPDNYKNM